MELNMGELTAALAAFFFALAALVRLWVQNNRLAKKVESLRPSPIPDGRSAESIGIRVDNGSRHQLKVDAYMALDVSGRKLVVVEIRDDDNGPLSLRFLGRRSA